MRLNIYDTIMLTCARTAAANCKLGSKVSGTTCKSFDPNLLYEQVMVPIKKKVCMNTYVWAAEPKVETGGRGPGRGVVILSSVQGIIN